MTWFPLCAELLHRQKGRKNVDKLYAIFFGSFFSRSTKSFSGQQHLGIFFITSKCRDCLIPPLQRYHYKSTPDGQLTYLHVEQALGLGTKNMLNFLINLFTSRNGFLSMSFKSTSSSIFLHPKYYLHVVLRTFFFIRLSK